MIDNAKDNIKILRVISCIGVLTVHLGQRMELTGSISLITNFGQYGVFFFFLISGYLIASSYEKYGKQHVFKFIIKKILRVLPLYYAVVTWFYITDTFLFHFYVTDETGVGWKRYFLFLNGFIQPGQDPYGYWSNLGASWTIPCFVFAYLFVPVYLHLMNKLRGGVLSTSNNNNNFYINLYLSNTNNNKLYTSLF